MLRTTPASMALSAWTVVFGVLWTSFLSASALAPGVAFGPDETLGSLSLSVLGLDAAEPMGRMFLGIFVVLSVLEIAVGAAVLARAIWSVPLAFVYSGSAFVFSLFLFFVVGNSLYLLLLVFPAVCFGWALRADSRLFRAEMQRYHQAA